MPVEATEATFEQEVVGKREAGARRFLGGVVRAVPRGRARARPDRRRAHLKLVKVNIDQEQGLAQRFGVASIPMMVLFENGEPQAAAVGALPKGMLERALGLSRKTELAAPAGRLRRGAIPLAETRMPATRSRASAQAAAPPLGGNAISAGSSLGANQRVVDVVRARGSPSP